MNAQETLELFRKRYDVTLPSGMNVTIRLPRLADCIVAGGIPLPVLQHMTDGKDDGKPASAEDMARMRRFQDEIVLRTLVAVEGEPVEMTLEAVAEIDQGDYDALWMYGQRATPVPTNASSPA